MPRIAKRTLMLAPSQMLPYIIRTQCVEKVKALFLPAFSSGCIFWPIANVINFRYVPSTHRVLYVNAMGLIWNAFLR